MKSSQKLDNQNLFKVKKGRNPLFIFLAAVICFFLFSIQSEIRAQVPADSPTSIDPSVPHRLDSENDVTGSIVEGKKDDPSLKELKKEMKKSKNTKKKKEKKGD